MPLNFPSLFPEKAGNNSGQSPAIRMYSHNVLPPIHSLFFKIFTASRAHAKFFNSDKIKILKIYILCVS